MSEKIAWQIAEQLRDRFLSTEALRYDNADYWRSLTVLKVYDETFGQRIGWKWNAVIDELLRKAISFPEIILDWGAGTGIATRRLLTSYSGDVKEVRLFDRSSLALEFAKGKITSDFPDIAVTTTSEGLSAPEKPFALVISHVLGELTTQASASLIRLAESAQLILWVEPGTPELSLKLISIREKLRDRFSVVAPCPHQNTCGLLGANSRDWCHFFASPPQEVFHSSFWREFSQKLKIDLRSLPVSFLVLARIATAKPKTLSRVIGRPRDYKGVVKALLCEPTGQVEERSFIKSKSKSLCQGLLEGAFESEVEATWNKPLQTPPDDSSP